VLVALPLGCRSAGDFHHEADREVYAILEQRREELLEQPDVFRIDPPDESLRVRILAGVTRPDEIQGLSLADCLAIAAENSREYQRRKEQLYLTALDLTLERFRFDNQYGGILAADANGVGNDGTTQSASAAGSLSRLLGSGAQILGGIGLSLAKDLASGSGWNTVSTLDLAVTQPLLRGTGRFVVREPLRQAERDVVYEVRSFERFRRTFGFDVAARVYRILQQMDRVANQESNFANLLDLRERNVALGESGRLSEVQVDQARQQELQARSSVISTRQQLQGLLDDFKLFLGLPIDAPIGIRREELVELIERGLVPVELDENVVVGLALAYRPDYLTAQDRVYDAERRVRIAADALRAGLELGADFFATSDDENPLKFRRANTSWGVDLTLDLPIQRVAERNAFRAAEIQLERERRNATEFADGIRADLRDALRELTARREDYEIQVNSVLLAERRIESARLNLEAGRALTRDLLEAQEDLVDAQNARTNSLIDYTLASLALYLDVGFLRLDESGLTVAPELYEELQGPSS